MRFSIATPTRNALPMLRRCVGSVRGQSYKHYEHLVQDGVSTDGSTEWLSDQNGLNWQSEKDAGMYDAINRAWSRSQGDILSWLNADEQYLPGTLEHVDAVFRARPEIDIVWGNAILVTPEGDPISVRQDVPARSIYLHNDSLYLLTCTLFYRRELSDRGLLTLDTKYQCSADKALVLRLIEARCRFLHVPDFLSLFTISGENLSMSTLARKEGDQIQSEHGCFKSRTARRMIALGRKLEKYLRGCYHRPDLDYEYALDETPLYRQVQQQKVRSRLSRKEYLNWNQNV